MIIELLYPWKMIGRYERDQLNQLKESLALLDAALENRSCSLDDLLESHDRITDEEVYEYYDGTLFSEEDSYI